MILPFWTSFLLRVYAWIGLLGNNSWFNKRPDLALQHLLAASAELQLTSR